MSSKLLSVLEERLVTLIKIHVGRDNLEVARVVTSPAGDGLDVVHMELYTEDLLKCGDLGVDGGNRWVAGMLEQLSTTAHTRGTRDRIKVFHGRETAKAVIHFENVEDMLHWIFSHGGYITRYEDVLQTQPPIG